MNSVDRRLGDETSKGPDLGAVELAPHRFALACMG